MKNLDVYIITDKDPRRESLIQEQLASGILKRHPDDEKNKKKPSRYTNEYLLEMFNKYESHNGTRNSFCTKYNLTKNFFNKFRDRYEDLL